MIPEFAALNAWVQDRVVRHWQWEAFATGRLPPTDWTAGLPFLGTLYVAPPKVFAYAYGPPLTWLFTDGPANGYALQSVLLADGTLLGEPSPALEAARALHPVAPAGAAVVLVAGQQNFAHLVWNELPGLIAAEAWVPGRLTQALVTAEPIAPLHRLLHWPHAPFAPALDAALSGLQPALLFPLGSALVTPEAKARVRDACGPPAWRARGRPVLWFTLRLMYRHPTNQEAAFAALLDRLGPGVDVLLDGFSLPADLDVPGRYPADYYRGHHARVRDMAARLARPGVHDMTGADLPGAIALAGQAGYYVAHAGTQQHKIGWLHNVPGTIHANARWSRNEPNGIWTSTQAGSPVQPVYLPADLVAADPTQGERQDDPDWQDYRITNPAAFAEFVIADMHRTGFLDAAKRRTVDADQA